MDTMKKAIAMMLVLLMALSSALALAQDASVEAITEKGKFILGLDDGFPPMGYRDDANNIVGYDIDLAKEVCARLGVELVLQPVEWAAKELELSSGNIDCIWNGMSITPAREEAMSMTFSYLNNEIVLYAMKDSGIATLEDMAGKKIAVQSGSFAEEVLTEYDEYAGLYASVSETLGYEDYLTALMDLAAGGVDAVLIDKVVADFRIKGMGSDAIVPVVSLADDNFGIGFRKADVALRDKVQQILQEMAADGTVAKISTEWFGSDISTIPAA